MKETNDLMSRLNNVSNEKGLDVFIKDVDNNHTVTFTRYINKLMIERNLYKADVARLSKLDRSYTSQIIDGSKNPGRDKVLSIALGLNLSLDETQKLLTLAKVNPLYPRSRRDDIIIYAINKKMSLMDTNAELARYNEAELS